MVITQEQINQLTVQEESLINSGQMIPALRAIRARTGCGLKEAKDALEGYKAKAVKEQLFYQPTTVVAPQGNNYGCVLCTLEYLSGVPRDDIAQEIGHDGSEIVDADEPPPYCHAALTDGEAMYWMFKRGYQPTQLVTYEYIKYAAEQHKPGSFYEKRFYPEQSEIPTIINGKAAELTVKSHKFKHAIHSVAWLGEIVLDPRDGCVHRLWEYEILTATITTIDPYERLSRIHAAQPKEQVVRV